MSIAFEVLAAHLLAQAPEVLSVWFPQGRRQGREWCVGSLEGQPGQSLKINMDSGRWQDFATGEKGGDLIALYAAKHSLSQGDAARQLGAEDDSPHENGANGIAYTARTLEEPSLLEAPKPEKSDELERPPPGAPYDLRVFSHVRHGGPSVCYVYRDAEGAPLYVVARYDSNLGKEFAPWTWRDGRWRAKGPPKPRPLYGLDRLARLERRVVIVEGEKAADALQGALKLSPVVTWSSGATNWRYADWTPLIDRSILVWPDADPPGVTAMSEVAGKLLAMGCKVERIDVEGLSDGYDAADLIASGVTGDALTQWIRARIKPIPKVAAPEPDRVTAPIPVEGTLIEHDPPDNVPRDIPTRHSPSAQRQGAYAIVADFGLKMGPRGPHVNLANLTLLLGSLVDRQLLEPIWWDSFLTQIRTPEGEWLDRHTLELVRRCQDQYELDKVTRETIDQTVALYAWQHQRNCAQDWLYSLKWDGVERLDFLLEEGFGTARTEYTMAVGRCFVMGMVARVLMPGCQVDNLPVFEGEQGITKSQSLRALGGPWYAETMESVVAKDFYLALAGKILVEISEFSSFKRAEAEAIKSAISRPTDRYRVPYDKRAADHPRSCVFAATTNDMEWNLDPTGARRFWPVKCGSISVEWIRQAREQLFAEAVVRVLRVPIGAPATERLEAGAAWWDVPDVLARGEQKHRFKADTLASAIRSYVRSKGNGYFTIMEVVVYGLGLDGVHRLDNAIQNRIRSQLVHWGYRSHVKEFEGAPERFWFRPSSMGPESLKPPQPDPEE